MEELRNWGYLWVGHDVNEDKVQRRRTRIYSTSSSQVENLKEKRNGDMRGKRKGDTRKE